MDSGGGDVGDVAFLRPSAAVKALARGGYWSEQ